MFIYVCVYLNCIKLPVHCTHTLFPTCVFITARISNGMPEGNVFTDVCLFTGAGGIRDPDCFPDLWSQVLPQEGPPDRVAPAPSQDWGGQVWGTPPRQDSRRSICYAVGGLSCSKLIQEIRGKGELIFN